MAKQARSSPPRLVVRDGESAREIVRLGDRHSPWRDIYHALLTMPWPAFIGLLLLVYLALNSAFAVLYWLGGDGAIANARPGSLPDAFFFSVQTMASIGYGALYPQSLYANIVVVLESFVGLLFIAMATGISFARFSVPTARILFSRYAVVAPVNQVPMLMFRTANRRRNRILEARLWVTLVRDEATQEGEELRRFYDLALVRSQTPLFALTWTAMHPIDAQSPLYGATPDSLKAANAEVIVIIAGMDETTSQTIHSRHSFVADEILWNYRFEDILGWTTDGHRAIDYTQFDQVRAVSSR